MALPRIALDAMGGDRAPRETVQGAVQAVQRDPELTVLLVGSEPEIRAELEPLGGLGERLEIVHASQVITGHDSPVDAFKARPDASIKVAAELVRDRKAHGLVAAGNTGAAVAAATLIIKLLPGVRRPGIAVTLPSASGGHTVLCDAGANIHCKALHLYHYGIMAAQYAHDFLGHENPRVGLLNIGSEEGKGTDLVKETASLFARGDVNFIGNVEGNDVFSGRCEVIICEGFVGNVVLKTAEGLYEVFAHGFSSLRDEISQDRPEAGEPMSAILHRFKSRMDWAEYGGAPLLGIAGLVLISHGRSDARAIRNALLQAGRLHRKRVLQHMQEGLAAS